MRYAQTLSAYAAESREAAARFHVRRYVSERPSRVVVANVGPRFVTVSVVRVDPRRGYPTIVYVRDFLREDMGA